MEENKNDMMTEIITQNQILDDVLLECNEKCIGANMYMRCIYSCLEEHKVHEFLRKSIAFGFYKSDLGLTFEFRVRLKVPEDINRIAVPVEWVKMSLEEFNKTHLLITTDQPIKSLSRIIYLFSSPLRRIDEDPTKYSNQIMSNKPFEGYYAVLDRLIPHAVLPVKVEKLLENVESYELMGKKLGYYMVFEKKECKGDGCHWVMTDEQPEAYVDEYTLQLRNFNCFRVFKLLNVSNALVHRSVFISTPAETITVSGIQDAMASVYFIAPTKSKVEIEFEIEDLLKRCEYIKDKVEFSLKGTDTPARW